MMVRHGPFPEPHVSDEACFDGRTMANGQRSRKPFPPAWSQQSNWRSRKQLPSRSQGSLPMCILDGALQMRNCELNHSAAHLMARPNRISVRFLLIS